MLMENADHSTLSKNNAEEYIQSIAADPNLRGMLYHNLLHRNAILNQQNEKVCATVVGSMSNVATNLVITLCDISRQMAR